MTFETIGALSWRVLQMAKRARKGQVTSADRREPASEVTVGYGLPLHVTSKQASEPSLLNVRIKPDRGRLRDGELE